MERMESMQKAEARRLNRGLLLVIGSALCWSLNSPLVKLLTLDPFLLTGLRALIAALVLAPFIRLRRIRRSLNTAMMIFFYMIHCTLIVLALKKTSAPIAVAMQFTAPVWLFLYDHRKGGAVRFGRLWPLCVMMLGMVLFMFSGGTGVTMAGNLIAACSSLSFAALTFFSKRTAEESDNPIGLTSLSNFVTALVVLLAFVRDPVAKIAAVEPAQWPLMLLLGAVQTGGGYGLYFAGLKDVDASTAAMLSPLEMVLGPLWVALFLHEYTDVIGLIAFLLVIVGVLGEVLVTKRQQTEPTQAA